MVLKGKMLEKAEWNFFDKVSRTETGKKRGAKRVAPKGKRNGIRAGVGNRPSMASGGTGIQDWQI